MGLRLTIVLAAIISSASFAATEKAPGDQNKMKYAIAYCLSKAYPDTPFSSDAGHVAGAYLDRGAYGIDVYEAIRRRVDNHTPKEYVSKHDRNLSIMRCLDFMDVDDLLDGLGQ